MNCRIIRKKSVVCKYVLTSISQFEKNLQLVTSGKLLRYASVSILAIHYHSDCWYRTVVLSYLSNVLFQRLKVIQYFCNHIIIRLKKQEKEIAPFVEEARTDDSFGDIDAWTCPSESVVGGGSLARSRTSPAMVALLLFFFRWVNSTSPWHY